MALTETKIMLPELLMLLPMLLVCRYCCCYGQHQQARRTAERSTGRLLLQ